MWGIMGCACMWETLWGGHAGRELCGGVMVCACMWGPLCGEQPVCWCVGRSVVRSPHLLWEGVCRRWGFQVCMELCEGTGQCAGRMRGV